VTLAYAADGTLLWEQRFDGATSGFDDAYAIDLDDSGAVYVGGDTSGATSVDVLVLKYAPDGTPVWQASYDGPDAGTELLYDLCAVGGQGVAITGMSEGNGTDTDFVTLRFDDAGNLLWSRRFDGSSQRYDVPYSVDVDPSGRVAVCGASVVTTSAEGVCVLYDADGTELWTRTYQSPSEWFGDTQATQVQFDGQGELLVIGRSGTGPSTGDDGVALRYDLAGTLTEELRYDGPAHATDWLFGGTIDARGSIIATGLTIGPGGSIDLLLVKLR
jgi:outer membrane protein assembly factor BamB